MKRLLLLLVAGSALVLAAAPLMRRSPTPEILRSPPAAALPAPAPAPPSPSVAEGLYWRGEHDSARVAWTQELAVTRDSARIAVIRTWLGLAAWRLGEYDAARTHGEAALALKLRLGADSLLPVSYNALGLLAWNQGRLTDAAHLYEEGRAIARRVNDVVTLTKLAGNIGLVETEVARFEQARAGFEQARVLAQQTGETRLEGNALTNLAMLDIRTGDAAAALPRLHEARRLYARAEYTTGEQNALGQLSTAYAALGDLQRAFATLDSANDLAARQDLKQEIASNLEIMGDLYRDAGDRRSALAHYQRAQDLNRQLALEVERGAVLRKIAEAQYDLGARGRALAAAREAAAIHEATGARHELLRSRLLLAGLDSAHASSHLDAASVLARAIASPSALAALALARAREAAARDDGEAVLRVLAVDAGAIERYGFDAEAEAATLRAQAHARARRFREAAADAEQALAALERARATLGSGVLRAGFVARRADLYERLIDAFLRAGRVSDALRVSEHGRARASGGPATRGAGDRTAAALQRVRALTDAVNELDAQIADGDGESETSARREALSRELRSARSDYEALVARVAGRPAASGVATTAQLQRALGPGEIVIEYFIGREHAYAFLVRADGMRAVRLAAAPADLTARVKLARASLARAGSPDSGLTRLHSELLGPFAAELRAARRVVIVPHGALAYLPFGALRSERDRTYLIERAVVAYAPSGSDLVRLRMAAAVPVMPGAAVFQPFPDQLPGSRAEARAVRRAWRGARVLREHEANARELRRALASDRIVHVSSHGAMDARAPLFSYISLAADDTGSGRIEIHDINALGVRSPLVFLSGCETGLGTASESGVQSADDVSTFAHALLGAGARAAVATVWRIEDRSAAILAGAFYRELRKADAAEALARAQRTLLRSERHRDPFYWAAYMVTGEVDFRKEGGPAAD